MVNGSTVNRPVGLFLLSLSAKVLQFYRVRREVSNTEDERDTKNPNSNTVILYTCNYLSYYTNNFRGKMVRRLIEKIKKAKIS